MVLNFYVTTENIIDNLPTDLKPNWIIPIYTTYDSIPQDPPADIVEGVGVSSEYTPIVNPENTFPYVALSQITDSNYEEPYIDRSYEKMPEDRTVDVYAYPLTEVGGRFVYTKQHRCICTFTFTVRRISDFGAFHNRVRYESTNLKWQIRNTNGSWTTSSSAQYPIPDTSFYDKTSTILNSEAREYRSTYTYPRLATTMGEVLRGLSGTLLQTQNYILFYYAGVSASTEWLINYPWVKYPTTSPLDAPPLSTDLNNIVVYPVHWILTRSKTSSQSILPEPVVRHEIENSAWNSFIRSAFTWGYITDGSVPAPTPTEDKGDNDYDDVVPTKKDYSSDEIDHTLPTFNLATNLVNVYSLTPTKMSAFAENMWDVSTWEAIQQKIANSKPMDYIIGLKVYPSNIYTEGDETNITLGAWHSTIKANKIASRYIRKSLGGVSVPYFYGNYVDYQTKISVYLPFVGVRPLNVQDIIGSNLELFYDIDIITGDCVATIKVTRNIDNVNLTSAPLYYFNGVMGCDIPLTSNAYSTFLLSTIGKMLGGSSSVAGMGGANKTQVGGMIAQGVAEFGNKLTDTANSLQTSVDRCGSLGGNSGLLAPMQPYLIIERPVEQKPSYYNDLVGNTSRQNKKLSACKGYTIVENIDVVIPNATKSEIDEIRSGLLSGVYIK